MNMFHGCPSADNTIRRSKWEIVEVLMQGMSRGLSAWIWWFIDQLERKDMADSWWEEHFIQTIVCMAMMFGPVNACTYCAISGRQQYSNNSSSKVKSWIFVMAFSPSANSDLAIAISFIMVIPKVSAFPVQISWKRFLASRHRPIFLCLEDASAYRNRSSVSGDTKFRMTM